MLMQKPEIQHTLAQDQVIFKSADLSLVATDRQIGKIINASDDKDDAAVMDKNMHAY